MARVRVLVVDDSDTARGMLKAFLASDADIEVVGEAKDGREAVDMAGRLRPDIVTMDIYMPVMDGLEAIEHIMARHPVPILVVTGRSSSDLAFNALSKGALEVMAKPDADGAGDLAKKVKLLSKVKVITHMRGRKGADADLPKGAGPSGLDDIGIVAIASSTGGPKALSVVLPELPADLPCPVVVAQHINEDFVSGLADWLGDISMVNVKVAEDGESIRRGTVYISPAGGHMELREGGRVALVGKKPTDIYMPSCNLLLSSVADVYGAKSIGVILTGMGNDGTLGMRRIKEAGGVTIAQDEKTSAIYGMPREAVRSGCIDAVLPLEKIAGEIIHRLNAVARGAAHP